MRTLLRWLLPEICAHCRRDWEGDALCPDCLARAVPAEPPWCLRCGDLKPSRPLCCAGACRLIRGAFLYRGPALSLVHAFKFRGSRKAARLAGRLMAAELPRLPELAAVRALVPVPLHWRRLRHRGYNQAELLAEEISRQCGLPVEDLLERERATIPSWELDRRTRAKNMAGAFRARGGRARGSLLLIDDVCTTAATFDACAAALLAAGAESVCGYALARQGLLKA